VNVFIAVSKAVKDDLIKLLKCKNFSPDRIKIIYNGIDDSRYLLPLDKDLRHSLKINKNAFILGTVARLDPIKNQKMMIKALWIIRKKYPNIYLLIVGDGPERANLKSLAKELGLSSYVLFTGFKEDVHRYLKIFDIFLLTSFFEGMAITILEAMASNLPCIVTDSGGPQEIVKDGETGFIIPCDDEIALSEKIDLLFNDANLKKRMGEAGRKRFEEKFTMEKMFQSYKTIYKKVTKF
jgi:glycosyltransferase involved in cell wall biosynthesis